MALTIDGVTVPDEIIQGEFSKIKGNYERMLQVECCERDFEFLAEAKEKIVSQVLLEKESQKTDVEISSEQVDEILEQTYQENGGKDRYMLEMGLRLDQENTLKKDIKAKLQLEGYIKQISSPKPQWSEEDQRLYYQENINDFYCQEEVKASHISKTREGIKAMDEAYNELREARRLVMDGETFEEVAERYTNDSEMDVDLGFFKRGEFIEQFETIAFSMNKDEISPIFATHLGLHICKVTDRIERAPIPFPDIQKQVEEKMWQDHQKTKMEEQIKLLKKSAAIADSDPEGRLHGGH